jgi:hypothetical protein
MKKFIPGLLGLWLLSITAGMAQSPCYQDQDGSFRNPDGSPCTNTVTTAVPFLRITPTARPGAMGDVGVGISPDPSAMHFNSSKIPFAEEKLALSASYTPWLRSLGLNDVYLAYLGGYYRFDDQQALGFGLRYFSMGSIQYTDENGINLLEGRPNEFEVAAGYSRKLSERFTVGVTGKFIFSNLAAGLEVPGTGEVLEAGIAGAADISFSYNGPIRLGNTNSNILVGLAITNIGNKISYSNTGTPDFLPANFGLGAAWNFELDDYNRISIAADINKLLVPTPCQGDNCDEDGNGVPDYKEQSSIGAIFTSWADAPEGFSEELKEFYYSFGLEYDYNRLFRVQAGYFYEHPQKGGRQYFTVGLGLRYNVVGIDVAYLIPSSNQRNPLDNTLRFTLNFLFNDLGKSEDPELFT